LGWSLADVEDFDEVEDVDVDDAECPRLDCDCETSRDEGVAEEEEEEEEEEDAFLYSFDFLFRKENSEVTNVARLGLMVRAGLDWCRWGDSMF
jgi:hypothetical protein